MRLTTVGISRLTNVLIRVALCSLRIRYSPCITLDIVYEDDRNNNRTYCHHPDPFSPISRSPHPKQQFQRTSASREFQRAQLICLMRLAARGKLVSGCLLERAHCVTGESSRTLIIANRTARQIGHVLCCCYNFKAPNFVRVPRVAVLVLSPHRTSHRMCYTLYLQVICYSYRTEQLFLEAPLRPQVSRKEEVYLKPSR